MSPPPRSRRVDPLIAALRTRRESLLLSLSDVAPLAGTSRSAISRRELGREVPNLASLRAWADALGCDLALIPRTGYEVDDSTVGIRSGLRAATRIELVESLTRARRSARSIAAELGIHSRTVVRDRNRIRQRQESAA